jgi:hypothetical protein
MVNVILGGNLARESEIPEIKIILNNQELKLKTTAPVSGIDIQYKGMLNTALPQFEKAEVHHSEQSHVLLYSLKNEMLKGEFVLGHVSDDFELIEMNVASTMGQVIAVNNAMMPTEFALAQNYPNPFNPITTIQLDVPKISHVTLSVYNVRGEEVIRLVDSNMNAGYHTVQWNATNTVGQPLPAGIYFYRMIAGDFQSVKRMVVIK